MVHKNEKSQDHYVSQTYLTHFSFSEKFVYVYRKKEKYEKDIPIKSICVEVGGDLCNFYENRFAVREILSKCEPLWNIFIESVLNKTLADVDSPLLSLDENEIPLYEWVLLYLAYLRCWSPVSIQQLRLQEEFFYNRCVLPFSRGIDDVLRSKISNGSVRVEIDDKDYHKHQVIQLLCSVAKEFRGKNWDILVNETDVKFITSDTPFTPMFPSLYLPLTPRYALVIRSDSGAKINYKKIDKKTVKKYNKEVVKYAKDLVISSEMCGKLSRLVDNHRYFRPEVVFHVDESNTGVMKVFFQHKSICV